MSGRHTDVDEAVARARQCFELGRTRQPAARRRNLKHLRTMLVDHEHEFAAAVRADLGKSEQETGVMEISLVLGEISNALKRLTRWTRPQPLRLPVALWPGHAQLVAEPLGVVLILAPWNYPIQLLLTPLVGVLAAGNTAVLKPSSQTPRTTALLTRLIPRYFPDDAVTIVDGGEGRSDELLAQNFDHIIFTGSARVGRIVMRAAAENLTPVTLELGGKSPAWFDDDRNLDAVARRLTWAKFSNAGQTCVAPDYVMTTPDRVDALVEAIRKAIGELWGADPRTNPDYGRIISPKAVDRLAGYLDGVQVVAGGDFDRDERYMAPTVIVVEHRRPVVGPGAEAAAMREEIFGPVLPIVPVSSPREAVDAIREFDKPLALYVFSSSRGTRKLFEQATSSGSVVNGAALIQLASAELPFGGVGGSGMGHYHGEFSFRTFSHLKPVLTKPQHPDTLRLVQPPYGRGRLVRAVEWVLRRG